MTAASEQALDQFVDRIEKIHTSVGVAQRVLRLVDHPDFDMQQVVTLLESDPALATEILRLVNSSHFGLPRRIASLQHAVSILGMHTLRLTLLNHGVLQCLVRILPEPVRTKFLRNSLTIATVAEKLTRLHDEGNAGDAYCAGLLVDLGILALAQVEPTRYLPLFAEQASHADLLTAERDTFGFDHAQVGARLQERWNLPEGMVAATAQHHLLPRGMADEVMAVQVAVLVADVLWTPQSCEVANVRELLAKYYDLSVDDFIEFAVDCQRSLKTNAALCNVSWREDFDLETLRRKALELFVAESVATAVELDGLNALVNCDFTPFE